MTVIASEAFFSVAESKGTAARVGFLNDVYLLFRMVEEDNELAGFAQQCRANADLARSVAERVKQLLGVDSETGRLHPYDRAIAVYLVVLYLSNAEELDNALWHVYNASSHIRNLWLTYQVYTQLLPVISGDSTKSVEVPVSGVVSGGGEIEAPPVVIVDGTEEPKPCGTPGVDSKFIKSSG